jgi:GTP-binding protein HflX
MIDLLNSKKERVVIVGLAHRLNPVSEAQDSLDELALLCDSAGAEVVYSTLQTRQAIDPASYIGKGKAYEIAAICHELSADTVVFDEPLTASQRRNLEKILNIKVLDRTQVILDIFAQRARSSEGKLQVELAQLKYMLANLAGKGTELSRLGGGIGTRGPGEQKLEVDKRRIKNRIKIITSELNKIIKNRDQQRQARFDNEIHTFSIVGYTNAGKTTLFNKLTQLDNKASNKLFTTLDTLIRKITLPGGISVLISDTVGFINKLPPELVSAFKATLEEITYSSALIHVVDLSASNVEAKIASVDKILTEINADNKTKLLVFNKIDIEPNANKRNYLLKKYPDALFVSAKTGENIDLLLHRLESIVINSWSSYDVRLPFTAMELIHKIYENSSVKQKKTLKNSVKLNILAPYYLIQILMKDPRIRLRKIENLKLNLSKSNSKERT